MNITPQSFTFRLCAVTSPQECGTEVGGGGGTLQQRNLPSAVSGSDQGQHLQWGFLLTVHPLIPRDEKGTLPLWSSSQIPTTPVTWWKKYQTNLKWWGASEYQTSSQVGKVIQSKASLRNCRRQEGSQRGQDKHIHYFHGILEQKKYIRQNWRSCNKI